MVPRYDLKLKLIIIGDSDSFSPVFISTVGIDFRVTDIKILGKTVHLQIWDTAGQERYLSVTTSYYRGSKGAMVVYDVTDRKSFEHVLKWVQGASIVPDLQFLLCASKCDAVDSRVVTKEEGEAFARGHNCLYAEVSARTGANVRDAVLQLCQSIVAEKHESPPPSPIQLNPTPAAWTFKQKLKRAVRRC